MDSDMEKLREWGGVGNERKQGHGNDKSRAE